MIDEIDGIHVIFGMVIVPYILYIVQNRKMSEIDRSFAFLERMAMCQETRIKEVLDFTVLEQLADAGYDIFKECKQYMGIETLKHCKAVEEYFLE